MLGAFLSRVCNRLSQGQPPQIVRRCDAPLQGREGKFILKYFLVGSSKDLSQIDIRSTSSDLIKVKPSAQILQPRPIQSNANQKQCAPKDYRDCQPSIAIVRASQHCAVTKIATSKVQGDV